jgi:hypothetical protein
MDFELTVVQHTPAQPGDFVINIRRLDPIQPGDTVEQTSAEMLKFLQKTGVEIQKTLALNNRSKP